MLQAAQRGSTSGSAGAAVVQEHQEASAVLQRHRQVGAQAPLASGVWLLQFQGLEHVVAQEAVESSVSQAVQAAVAQQRLQVAVAVDH